MTLRRLRGLFGRPAQAGARPSRPLWLVPVNDIVGDQSTGSDPYFLLEPVDGAGFGAGLHEFAFEAGEGTVPLLPVLYLDTGAGFNEAETLRLAGGVAGRYRELIALPPGVQRIRFDPAVLAGPLPLRDARITALGPLVEGCDYAAWSRQFGALGAHDMREIAAAVAAMAAPPRVEIRVQGGGAVGGLREQIYPHWTLTPGDGPLLLLQAGDALAPHALYCLLQAPTDALAVITDEDLLDPATGDRTAPQFRCQPSLAALRGGDFPGAVLLRGGVAEVARSMRDTGPTAIRDLLERSVAAGRPVAHVPGVLVHRRTPTPFGAAPASAAVQHGPLVSIIIPTKDRVDLLRRTLGGLLDRTAYTPIEIILVDNGSEDAATLATYAALGAEPRVRLLRQPGPFNYAALNNAGAEAARGEVLVLMNNDMDVIGPDWLGTLVGLVLQPGIGAAGCMLRYGDGTVQHTGIVTGMTGLAGHPYRHADRGAAGERDALRRTREVSAVTGACLAIRRAVYLEIGGMDAGGLAVSYNDVDLCLRLWAAGLRVVWTPDAELFHLESASRGLDSRPDNQARAQREHDVLLRRWASRLLNDPFYNPNQTLADEGCGLAWPPRTPRPWRTG